MNNNVTNTLLNLGFTQQEINNYEYIYNNGGKFTGQFLQKLGYNMEASKRLIYMNKILSGEININTESDMITHYKKMTGTSREQAKAAVYSANLSNGYGKENYSEKELIQHLKTVNGQKQKIRIEDLKVSTVNSVPRVAVVSGIEVEPYTIWNSSNYSGKEALYKVIDVSGQKITVETDKKPILKYGTNKVINGVLELKGINQNGNAIVTFDKSVCKLCNRFIIVASLKRPEFHLGMYKIICFEGTQVYVYATNMGTGDKVHYKGGAQRIYAFGIFPQDISNIYMV